MKKNRFLSEYRKLSVEDRIFYLIIDFIMLIAALLVLCPLLNVVSSSISEPSMVLQGKVALFPKGLNFAGYKAVFESSRIMSGYANTIFYTVTGTLLSVALTIMYAYPLSRSDLVGRKYFMILITFMMLFSGGLIPT